jgi:hypothetical protein
LNLECRQKPLKTNEENMKTKEKQHQRKPVNKNDDNQSPTNEHIFKIKKKKEKRRKTMKTTQNNQQPKKTSEQKSNENQ